MWFFSVLESYIKGPNALGSSIGKYLDKVESDSSKIIKNPKQVVKLYNAYLISVQDQGNQSHATISRLMSGWYSSFGFCHSG